MGGPVETAYTVCHCGANCDWLGADADEPCWGEVAPSGISGDDDFCHACRGHYGRAFDGSPYEAAP